MPLCDAETFFPAFPHHLCIQTQRLRFRFNKKLTVKKNFSALKSLIETPPTPMKTLGHEPSLTYPTDRHYVIFSFSLLICPASVDLYIICAFIVKMPFKLCFLNGLYTQLLSSLEISSIFSVFSFCIQSSTSAIFVLLPC